MPSTFVVEYTSTVPSKADAPFDSDPIADVVIRTSDNVEFSLVRGVLQVASSFFRAMFALTQPVEGNTLQHIPIAETKVTFDALMRLCYPIKDPVIKDTPMLEKVLEAAMKYEMSEAVDILKTRLRGFIKASPRSVYAVACRLELEEEARMAATEWKTASSLWLHDIFSRGFASSVAGGSYAPNMATITSGAYFRLLQYVRVGTVASFVNPTTSESAAASGEPGQAETVSPRDTLDADVVLLSDDGVSFPAHSTVLRLAGASSLLSSVHNPNIHAPPEIQLQLRSSTLKALLGLIYPLPSYTSITLEEAQVVHDAATKHDLPLVAATAKRIVLAEMNTKPLSVYLIASMKGWSAEATEAARQAVTSGITGVYAPEMENVPALVYHHLLEFHHRYAAAVESIVGKVVQGTEWKKLSAAECKPGPLPVSLPLLEKTIVDAKAVIQQARQLAITTSLYCASCSAAQNPRPDGNCPVCSQVLRRTLDNVTVNSVLGQSKQLEGDLKKALAGVRW